MEVEFIPPIGVLPRICIDRREMREAPAISLHAHGLMDPAYRAWDRPGITDEHYSNYRTSVLVIFGEQSLRAETLGALLAFLAGHLGSSRWSSSESIVRFTCDIKTSWTATVIDMVWRDVDGSGGRGRGRGERSPARPTAQPRLPEVPGLPVRQAGRTAMSGAGCATTGGRAGRC